MRQHLHCNGKFTIFLSFLQCGFPVRQGDELLHIFTHHIKKTEDELQEILRTYMVQHLAWVERLSSVILHDVNVSLEDYVDTITTPGVPLDFVALVVLCSIYHIHVAVYTSEGLWSTCHKKDIRQCLFGIVYNGEFQFTETVKHGKGEQYHVWLQEHFEQGKLPSHHPEVKQELALDEKLCSVPEALSVVNNSVFCKHAHSRIKTEHSADSAEHDVSLQHSATSEYSDGFEDSVKAFAGVQAEHTEDSAKAVKTEHTEDSAKAVKTEHTEDSAKAVQAVKTEVRDENNNLVQDSAIVKADVVAQSDSSDEDADCEVLKCKEILHASDAEGPPMVYSSEVKLEALWDNVDKCVASTQSAVTGATASPSTDQQHDVPVIEINDEDLLLTCPVCALAESSQKKCLAHIADYHYGYRFKC